MQWESGISYTKAKQTGYKYKLARNRHVSNLCRERKHTLTTWSKNQKVLENCEISKWRPMLNTCSHWSWYNCANWHWKSWPSEFLFLLLLYFVTHTPGSVCISRSTTTSWEFTSYCPSCMDVTNANGPDGFSTGILKHTSGSTTPSITKFFDLSLCISCVPIVSVNNLWLCQILSQLMINVFPTNTDLSSLSKLLERHV